MQRRARVKAVANLTQRKVTNKSNAESQQTQQDVKKKEEITETTNLYDHNKKLNEQQSNNFESTNLSNKCEESNITINNNDDVNKCDKKQDKLNKKSSELNDKLSNIISNNQVVDDNSNVEISSKEDEFKTPSNLPRSENDTATQSSKFRRPKIMPRLTTSRINIATTSFVANQIALREQEYNDEVYKKNEEALEHPQPASSPQTSVFTQNERQTDSPVIFSPPSTPFSPTGSFSNRSRSDTPREISESPGFIVNQNLHYPPTPQSPFIPIPHSRIRTESICSLKSTTTVANLQPRKKVRTEDQKILDNKRESRERLSNKKIEKSQLRMFDMIYYNPSTNPMKPREIQKERPPKKIDLTAELPESVESESTTAPVPQLILNANGEMVLDESSLVVENEEQRKNRILLANTNVVFHDELSGSYGYYKRQQRTKEWPQEETIKFFRCLNTVGTDFSLMLNLFPNRSRRDLKLKFKKEEKNNPNLVDKALRNHSIFDIEELQRELEQEDEARRKEAENKSSEVKELVKRKILSKQEAKEKAQQLVKSKIEKILSDGDLILSNIDNQSQEIKENCETSGDTKNKIKRQLKKRKLKEEDEELSSQKNCLKSHFSATSKQTSSSSSEFVISNNDLNGDNDLEIGMTQSFESVVTKKDQQDAEMIHEFMGKVQKMGQNEDILDTPDDFLSNVISDTRELNSPAIRDSLDSISTRHDSQDENNLICDRIPKSEIEKSPITFVMKQEPCKTETIQEITSDLDEQPPQSVESMSLDDESFINSLDLERLVIVVNQVDGKDCYDIHETDAVTQKLSDKPLKLPRHIVDLIVSVMTQDD